jgi:dihydroorotate dehydrogenase
MNLYPLFKHLAFKIDPEFTHDLSLQMLGKYPTFSQTVVPGVKKSDKYKYNDGHMSWDFPIGLAAGFDKNAQAIDFFSRCGFGSVEVGTVTKIAQEGNPRPRIWRHIEIDSIRNAMGFPNLGAEVIKQNILQSSFDTTLGVNIGKNKDTTNINTPQEYAYLYEFYAPYCDYLVINISSPNTPGLRDLQTKDSFAAICQAVDEKRKNYYRPLYLKIAPDLAEKDIFDLVELVKEYKLSGIIATNTTIEHNFGKGGVSGKYLKEISKKVRKIVCEQTKETPEISVIGVGGIDTFEEILEFWKDGGDFVQIYSAFIYQGPALLQRIQKQIDQLLVKEQVENLQEFINLIKKSR